jgi:hypothetical protein
MTYDLGPNFHTVLQVVVKVLNFVEACPLNSQLLAVLREEMHTDHKLLLLHLDVRWLPRGKSLEQLI